jgi:hypothetical protein
MRLSPAPFVAALFLAGCPAEVAPPPEPVIEQPTTVEPAPAPAPVAAEDRLPVPSPNEIQRALTAAGIDTQLATLVQPRTLDLTRADEDTAAVRTGVVLADMLLTVKTSSNDQLLGQIDAIRTGMGQLGGGTDIDSTLRDIRERVASNAVTRDELLAELELLSGAVIPELEFNGRSRVVPLIQAGSWLEAANLVSKAVKAAGRSEAADSILKQPEVVGYFKRYVEAHGTETPAAITTTLVDSLTRLSTVASKGEPLAAEDIDTVASTTDAVLSLL